MKLRGVDYGAVFNASGARGFGGEGYWFHGPLRPLGLDYGGATFVSKTSTLEPRAGNMPLDVRGQPLARRPDCIVVKPFRGVALNAVGLSGPGLRALVDGAFAERERQSGERSRHEFMAPMVISLMSVAGSVEERLKEYQAMADILEPFVRERDAARGVLPGRPRTALQINFSCPNAGLDPAELVEEIRSCCDYVRNSLHVAVMAKVNALALPTNKLNFADAIVCSNTIPWGKLPERIDWKGLFGSNESPLARYGGGGLSGKPLLPIVTDWIRAARAAGVKVPIVGGGGILSAKDADRVFDAGADAVELGSVAMLRPWRVRGIVRHVERRMGARGAITI